MSIFQRKIKNKGEENKPAPDPVKKKMSARKTERSVPMPSEKKVFMPSGAILAHHLTEKTSAAARENKFIFLIKKGTNKNQVKQDIETRFKVGIDRINIINLPGKERRRGNQLGWKPGVKKAIVTVKKGQTIEIQ